MANPNPNPVTHQAEKLNRLPEVMDRTALSRSSIYLGMKKGTFPKPVHIGERAVAWRESDIQRWIDEREGGDAA